MGKATSRDREERMSGSLGSLNRTSNVNLNCCKENHMYTRTDTRRIRYSRGTLIDRLTSFQSASRVGMYSSRRSDPPLCLGRRQIHTRSKE